MLDRVPLWQHTVSLQFRTPRDQWKPSDQEIRDRVARAIAVASMANVLARRHSIPISEALLRARKEVN